MKTLLSAKPAAKPTISSAATAETKMKPPVETSVVAILCLITAPGVPVMTSLFSVSMAAGDSLRGLFREARTEENEELS